MYKCAQAVHSKYDKLRYYLGKLSSFPKQFPSGTQAVFKLVHHLDMYVHKRVSKLRTAYFCAVKNDQARFLIFIFNVDIIHSLSLLCREAIQSQCLPPTLYVNLIATYISGVCTIPYSRVIRRISHISAYSLISASVFAATNIHC